MIQNAVLVGGLTLAGCLCFYAVGYFSIPRDHRNQIANALPWVGILAFVTMIFTGTSAWLAYAGSKGAVVVMAAAGAVAASVGQTAVRRRFRNDEQDVARQ